jgi:hypothetical protein
MQGFDLQGIALDLPADAAFAFIADPSNPPVWTHAFTSVSPGRAVLRTPQGEVEIGLATEASQPLGTIDWRMTFPDGSVAAAWSRVVALRHDRCAYTFVLTLPPLPLEQLEGALEAQALVLAQELATLQRTLER